MNEAIQLTNVTKRYANFSLENVSLSLPRGCIMGLIGKNGAGKTTTLKLILGLRRPDSGSISLLGMPLQGHEAEIKTHLGVALDESRFSETFSPRDVNRVLRRIHQQWDENYFRSLTERFALPWTQPNKSYSRGMKMKLALSAALAHRPEPVSYTHLDVYKRQIQSLPFRTALEPDRRQFFPAFHVQRHFPISAAKSAWERSSPSAAPANRRIPPGSARQIAYPEFQHKYAHVPPPATAAGSAERFG